MAKKINSDGKIYYYYYKKKRGRKKKRGPKKKKPIIEKKKQSWDYKIIICESNKQDKYIGVYHDIAEVELVKKKIIEKNNSVIFPIKVKNSGKLSEFKSEYLILKRTNDAKNLPTKMPNEYGKWIDNYTTSDVWAIFDKFPALIEETFWVYGYNPKKDRKTFEWIINELLLSNLTDTDVIQIFIYNNKVIFKREDDIDFVICKNISDAIRMYNLLREYCNSNKIKLAIFTGLVNKRTDRTASIVKLLQKKTGWGIYKIYRTSTRS